MSFFRTKSDIMESGIGLRRPLYTVQTPESTISNTKNDLQAEPSTVYSSDPCCRAVTILNLPKQATRLPIGVPIIILHAIWCFLWKSLCTDGIYGFYGFLVFNFLYVFNRFLNIFDRWTIKRFDAFYNEYILMYIQYALYTGYAIWIIKCMDIQYVYLQFYKPLYMIQHMALSRSMWTVHVLLRNI